MIKGICQRCIQSHHRGGWDATDERLWEVHRLVICPIQDNKGECTHYVCWECRREVEGLSAPVWCVMQMEHMILGQKL